MTSSKHRLNNTYREVSKLVGEPVVNVRKIKVKPTKGNKVVGAKTEGANKAVIADEAEEDI